MVRGDRAAPPSAAGARRRATLALLVFGVVWGASYVWMKDALSACARHLPDAGGLLAVGTFLLVRFGVAAGVLLLHPAARRRMPEGALGGGLALGGLLLLAFLLQVLALRVIDPAVSAFLTSLYLVFTAVLARGRRRLAADPALLLGVVLATAGAAWISGPPAVSLGVWEVLTAGCALVFALHILATDAVTRRVPVLPVTLASLLWAALGSGLVCVAAGLRSPSGLAALPSLVADLRFLVPTVLCAVPATALALLLMNRWQRELPPVRAAVIYAFEPVWAALFAIGLGRGAGDAFLWLGGGAVLCGNLVAASGLRRPGAARAGAVAAD